MPDNKNSIVDKLPYIVFGIYAIALVSGVINHEPWRDEAQGWLLVKDTNIAGLLKTLPSEGHPPLWYFLIMPFVKAGFPYAFQNWLNAAIMLASVYIILFKTRLPLLVKLLIPFSYVFLFEYSLFARNYCLIVFFISAIISLYPQRFDKPLLFALCVIGLYNSHVLIFSFCLALTCIYLWDMLQYKKASPKVVGSFLLMCLFGLYLLPYLATSGVSKSFTTVGRDHLDLIGLNISYALLIMDNKLIAVLLFIGLCILLLDRTKAFLLLLAGVTGVLYILSYRFLGNDRHHGVLFLVVFGAYGIAEFYKVDAANIIKLKKVDLKYGYWLLAVVIAFQFQRSFARYIDDKDRPYSDAKNTADFIKDNHLENSILVGFPAMYTCAVLPYLPPKEKIYYPECQRYGTYYIYDSCFLKKKWLDPVENFLNITHNNFAGKLDKVVLILNRPVPQAYTQYFDLLYYSPEPAIFEMEMFCVYKFKPGIQ